ncbi:MAG TPA: hydrogenase subunit MbhD domain-containing protein [archaeon]|nr:hydrogenase subunit MbhD domain-containing protein [archaeon]
MYELLFDILLVIILGLTAMAVWSRDLLKSVIFLSAASVSTALVFFLLNAPDIAITKAAVEAGVATAVFVVAIQKTARFEKDKKEMIRGKRPEQNPMKNQEAAR